MKKDKELVIHKRDNEIKFEIVISRDYVFEFVTHFGGLFAEQDPVSGKIPKNVDRYSEYQDGWHVNLTINKKDENKFYKFLQEFYKERNLVFQDNTKLKKIAKKEKKKKGLTVDECVKKAREYISKNRMCLLVFDVKGSRKFPNKQTLINVLLMMIKDINSRFNRYFPKVGPFGNKTGFRAGFRDLFGDSSWAVINNAEIIPKIIEYQQENYPDIPLHWGVAKDLQDKEGMSLVKGV